MPGILRTTVPEAALQLCMFCCHYPNNAGVTNWVLGRPQIIEIDERPDKKFRQDFIGAPVAVASGDQEQTSGSLACSLPSLFLIWGEGWGMPRRQPRGAA